MNPRQANRVITMQNFINEFIKDREAKIILVNGEVYINLSDCFPPKPGLARVRFLIKRNDCDWRAISSEDNPGGQLSYRIFYTTKLYIF